MVYDQKSVLHLLRLALSEEGNDNAYSNKITFDQIDWDNAYRLFKEHAIIPLMSDIVKHIPENYSELSKKWKSDIYQNVYSHSRLVNQQEKFLADFKKKHIPVVVVKGTSVAKYYPKPQLRTMGDIDLLVKPEDYERAVCCLLENDCEEITCPSEIEIGRHRSFRNNEVSIELHHFFSLYADDERASSLDNLLFDAISLNRTELPDEENGLVLLSHIRQHLEEGLGLRQIIDWFMFV